MASHESATVSFSGSGYSWDAGNSIEQSLAYDRLRRLLHEGGGEADKAAWLDRYGQALLDARAPEDESEALREDAAEAEKARDDALSDLSALEKACGQAIEKLESGRASAAVAALSILQAAATDGVA